MDLRPFFIFKSKNSKDLDIIIEHYPSTVSPNIKFQEIYIEGRNGHLTINDSYKGYETYESYKLNISCALRNTDKIDDISAWLKGSGYLIIGNDRNYKYQATVSNKIDFNVVAKTFRRFLIQFSCQPFKYELTPIPITLFNSSQLENKGNVYSQPTITIQGIGNINIIVNGRVLKLFNVEQEIVLDSSSMNAYRIVNGIMLNQNNKVDGHFQNFNTGTNTISWTGNVTRVVIQPNWRWI